MFLPVTEKEMYDPAFGHAIISRLLESRGYRGAILSQPNWKNADDFKRFGKPRLGFLVNS